MGLKNKHFAKLGEFAVYGPEDESKFVPLGYEFEFMMAEIDLNLDRHGLNKDRIPPAPVDPGCICGLGEDDPGDHSAECTAAYQRWNNEVMEWSRAYNGAYDMQEAIKKFIKRRFPPRLFKYGGDCGLEIRSFVAPLSHHKTTLKRLDFWNLPHSSTASGAGIHIAIGCNDYTNPIKDKLFTYLNAKENAVDLQRLSGRSESHFRTNCGSTARAGNWNRDHQGWNRTINDSHDYGPRGSSPSQEGRDIPAFVRYRADGRLIESVDGVSAWRKGWWECRLFHGRRQFLLPALEFCDAAVRVAHEPGPLTTGALYEYARAFPRYKELAMLMSEQLGLGKPKGRSKHARSRNRADVSLRRSNSEEGTVEVTEGSIVRSIFIDPIFGGISRALHGLDPEAREAESGEEGSRAA
jgi:hypothetical protein